MTLWELSEPVSRLRGVGGATARDLANLGIKAILDLLLFVPRTYEDRRTPASFGDALQHLTASDSARVNTRARVVDHSYIGGRSGKRTLKVQLIDGSGRNASLLCFGRNFLASKLPPGAEIRLFGHFQHRYGELQASGFEFEHVDAPGGAFDRILPVYPLSGSLTQGGVRRLTETALAHYGSHLVSTLPAPSRTEGWTTSAALHSLHFPEQVADAESARKALAFEEFLLLQLRIVREALIRRETTRSKTPLPVERRRTLARALPFSLTDDQERAVEEIHSDLESSQPMHRLLQGDVGSGKTLVALLSAVACIEGGYQVALMAPTELLARQHADNAARMLEPAGIRTAFLTGSLKRSMRTPLLAALAAGEVDLAVGTHALFTAEVTFRNLKLAIIDEQQRFGVLQRAALQAKGPETDLLITTATPIPRTLALGLFGDVDISTIRTMPPGRKPVVTHLARAGNEAKVYERVRAEIARGNRAYFVYPLIEEGVTEGIKNATAMRDMLAGEVFPEARIGLVHSRIPEEEKEATMAAFSRGDFDILVATSVVEVGVDVASATCMVIEHAERFGLSALHQLRGRVGRSHLQSYCFLLYSEELTDAGKERMRVMHRTNDGFEIAEEDLRIRGPGNVVGTRQSGFVRLHIADLAGDFALLQSARHAAERVLADDRGLLQPAHQPLRAALGAFSERVIEG